MLGKTPHGDLFPEQDPLLIQKIQERRGVWVVGTANSVAPQVFDDIDILFHQLQGHSETPIRMFLMPVDAFQPDYFVVQQQLTVAHRDGAETNALRDIVDYVLDAAFGTGFG